MGKKGKKNEHRVEFALHDFFVEKLKFENGKLYFGSNARADEVAKAMGMDVKKILVDSGLSKNDDPHHILDDEQIAGIALNEHIEFEKVDDVSAVNVVDKILTIMDAQDWDERVEIKPRPPVITIMGHVDHGKTTLLDTIRKSNLTTKEAGGITQTIGAYQIENHKHKFTFIDTPGHEAFTEMRANGSRVTDIVIIVVAADDSIMPQTRESIDHAKAAGVPIVVAVNKMDAPGANIEKVKQDLTEIDVIPEDWGGDVPFMPVSALKGEGIDDLLDTVNLVAEMQNLTAPENILASGTVIESNIHKQRGNLVSVIVQNGTLKVGDDIIMDDFIGRVKAMTNDLGKAIQVATPGTPVEIFGLGQSPVVGSKFVVTKAKDSQKIADEIHEARLNKQRERKTSNVADLFAQMGSNKKSFNVILKADALGVLEAITAKVEAIGNDDVEVKVIRRDVGEISTTDVTLAEASKGHIYTFNLKSKNDILALAKNKGVNIYEFDIIYKMFEDIENKINGLTEDKFEEKEIGKVEIMQLFSFSKVGTILGSLVREGSVKRDSVIEVERNGKIVATTKVKSLQFEKDQLKEAVKGRECGITLEDQNTEFQVGDILIAKELIKVE